MSRMMDATKLSVTRKFMGYIISTTMLYSALACQETARLVCVRDLRPKT